MLIFKSARTGRSINRLNTGDAGKLERHKVIAQTLIKFGVKSMTEKLKLNYLCLNDAAPRLM